MHELVEELDISIKVFVCVVSEEKEGNELTSGKRLLCVKEEKDGKLEGNVTGWVTKAEIRESDPEVSGKVAADSDVVFLTRTFMLSRDSIIFFSWATP